jgi:hypothetical protein
VTFYYIVPSNFYIFHEPDLLIPSSCWSQSSFLSLPTLSQIRRWEVVGIRQNLESKTGSKKGDQLSYLTQSITSLKSTPSSFILFSAQAPRSPKYLSCSGRQQPTSDALRVDRLNKLYFSGFDECLLRKQGRGLRQLVCSPPAWNSQLVSVAWVVVVRLMALFETL